MNRQNDLPEGSAIIILILSGMILVSMFGFSEAGRHWEREKIMDKNILLPKDQYHWIEMHDKYMFAYKGLSKDEILSTSHFVREMMVNEEIMKDGVQ